jgi:replication-associated recombination protein RarA
MSYVLFTERGYDFFEVSSALQKTIRRGLDEEAVYWAFEFIPKFETYVWKRLKGILNEDIGIANPGLIPIIEALENQYFQCKDTLALTNAVLLMARSQKTRIACHLSIVMEQNRMQNLPKRPIPDYALDMHTSKGRAKGRGYKEFRAEGAILENVAVDIDDRYESECYRLLKTEKRFPKVGLSRLKAAGEPVQNGNLFDKQPED